MLIFFGILMQTDFTTQVIGCYYRFGCWEKKCKI